jgi:hypothetical protein
LAFFYVRFSDRGSTRSPLSCRLLLLLCLFVAWGTGRAATQNGAAAQAVVGGKPAAAAMPDLRVEFFGAERGYSVGAENVPVLCILRNAGTAMLPANSVRLYCYPLVGLDYTSGEIKPSIPELAPGQSVAFRWQLAPGSGQGRLLTAVMLQSNTAVGTPIPGRKGVVAAPAALVPPQGAPVPSGLPRAVLAAIPHFSSQPALGSIRAGTATGPVAVAHNGEVWLANDRVSLHVRAAAGEEAVLSLAAKEGVNWRVLATANSLFEVLSSEDGQKAWWQRFQWQETAAHANRDAGLMTLSGSVGERWGVAFVVAARRDTGVMEGRIRLTARRNTRLFGVRLPGLLMQTDTPGGGLGRADGRAIALPLEDASVPEGPRLVAAHRGGVTFGLAWPAHAPLEGWTTEALLHGNSSLAMSLDGSWTGPDCGDLILAGATIEFPFRFFAFAPSDTVHDAQRFALP